MEKIVFLLVFVMNFSYAQSSGDSIRTLLLDKEYTCPLSKSDKLSDGAFVWRTYEETDKEFQNNQFLYVKAHFQSKTRYSGVLSDYLCVQVSTIDSEDRLIDSNMSIRIYEVCFEYKFQIEKILKVVKKYKVEQLDWPDASIPVKFYQYGLSLFIFLTFQTNRKV
jgi:hypothetical protein